MFLKNRRNVVAGILAAGIIDCVKVRVTPDDIPIIRVMGCNPIDDLQQEQAGRDRYGSLFDGMHRMPRLGRSRE